jgi:hypothetical protein
MTRTIAFLLAGAFALTVMVQEARSASFNPISSFKQITAGTNLVQQVYGCHTNCRWGWYRAGNGKIDLGVSPQYLVVRFRVPLRPKSLPLVALVAQIAE